ncbi:MAG: hypothetical protein MUO82_01380, partial [Candidatus Thermoplasmatota archaeon]|nr:hypothetical protein [Candidatus Thermoplasmatota archaeon]
MRKKIIIAILFLIIVSLCVGIFLIQYIPPNKPNVPTDFSTTVTSRTSIDLKWTKGDNADTTYIERNSI